MDFVSLTLFMVLYFIRPQEWIGGVATLRPVTVTMGIAILAMVLRPRGFAFRDLFRTSHDWLMLAYFVWIVAASQPHYDTAKLIYSLFMFYVVAVQALSATMDRIRRFLNWWTVLMIVVAALAIASEYGLDPMGSFDVTHGLMKDRLVLNTSIFNNPNALGHSVYPVLGMLYFILFWKRPMFAKVSSIPLVAVPLYCLYLTASKGAFLAGFVTVICALIFGRPKTVQILILVMACTVGWAALKTLPRMSQISHARSEAGIQGRLAAFTFGLNTLQHAPRGIGYDKFAAGFFKEYKYPKASHSTYVQIGAELGYPGLFLYLAILYCCLRTLFTAKTTTVQEERIRRILFVLLISYLASGWMVNFTYRATFFLITGAIAAFHRLLLTKVQPEDQTVPQTVLAPGPVLIGVRPAMQFAPGSPALALTALDPPAGAVSPPGASASTLDAPMETEPGGLRWTRFKWYDWLIVLILVFATIRFWVHIMYYL